MTSCVFCKIIAGDLPSKKLLETEKTLAFLDILPFAPGHSLVVPKFCGAKLTDIPDEYLQETLVVAKKIATAIGCENFNLLQNNGKIAFQEVPHFHLHIIPKTDKNDGLKVVRRETVKLDDAALEEIATGIRNKL